MFIKVILVWASLMVTVLDPANGNPCENGLPGRFCTEDLSSWYKCSDDGGEAIQTKFVNCGVSKRCTCDDHAYNTAAQDPSRVLVDLPVFPQVYTSYFVIKNVQCGAEGCRTKYFNGGDFQNADEGKIRFDQITSHVVSIFVLPKRGSRDSYDMFTVHWHKSECIRDSINEFPRLEFPSDFTYVEDYIEDGVAYYKWERCSCDGSYSKKQTVVTKNIGKDHHVPWTYEFADSDIKAKTNQTQRVEFSVFDAARAPDEQRFVLPSFCETPDKQSD